MSLMRQMRGGEEDQSGFGVRRRGTGINADLLAQRMAKAKKRLGLIEGLPPLAVDRFRSPGPEGQLALF